jgi:hypothetical protein
MNSTGKKARKTGGNRHACKRAKRRPERTSKYAAKVARWIALEKDQKRHGAQ